MEIRKACASDVPRLNELTVALHNHMGGPICKRFTHEELAAVGDLYDVDNIDGVYVAVVEGETVGYMQFSGVEVDEWLGKYLELYHIFVDENFRGTGIGRQLFEFFAAAAESAGAGMKATTMPGNEVGLRFYAACGLGPFEITLAKPSELAR